jgi:uncharacterized membrane protein YgdD (TMEM256/DUF423 family)
MYMPYEHAAALRHLLARCRNAAAFGTPPHAAAFGTLPREPPYVRGERFMHRSFLGWAGVLGCLAVALGAFGAHGLSARLSGLSDGAQRLEWWKTAAQYHLAHAVALGLAAGLLGETRLGRVACSGFIGGIVLFSGSLYAMTLTGVRVLGAVTPLGGLSFMLGWAALALAAFRS